MLQQSIKIAIIWALLQGCAYATIELGTEGDTKFDEFLRNNVVRYGGWIRGKDQDPSVPIQDMVIIKEIWELPVALECNITEQIMKGHSTTAGNFHEAVTDFDNHEIYISRVVHSPYFFQGIFNCSGIFFGSPSSAVFFKGVGNFTVEISYSSEFMEYVNFGITENYRFNKTNSWINYHFYPTLANTTLVGEWDQYVIYDEIGLVEDKFGGLYKKFLFEHPLNPSRKLFESFLDEIVTTTNLTEVLLTEELPQPYFPTSTTTTTTTLPTTTTWTTTEETTSTDISNTTSDTETQATGSTSRCTTQRWLLYIVIG